MSKEQILGLIRHLLTAAGGAVLMLGYFDEACILPINDDFEYIEVFSDDDIKSKQKMIIDILYKKVSKL